MPLVSRRKVHKAIEEKMYETFWEAISQLENKTEIRSFINDLLSPVERQMLIKRLAIATLLLRGYGYENIQDLVKVSQSTIAKVSIILNNNLGYRTVINKIAMAESTKEFWGKIEKLHYRLSRPGRVFLPEEIVKRKINYRRKTL